MKKLIYILFVFLVSFPTIVCSQQSTAKTDSSSVVVTKDKSSQQTKDVKVFLPNPKTAMLLSAIIPGAGQIYNRKYWKAPIVWGGYAALIYSISWNGHYYNEYKKAYISIADNDPNTNYYSKYIPVGQDSSSVNKTWLTDALNQKQLHYRRYRDLSIIGIVGFYGLTILDAYVDAQLYDFDISPNLSLHIEPVLTNGLTNTSTEVGVRCQLTF